MTGDELRRIRQGLGLSIDDMAAILRLGSVAVALMENGSEPVTGTVSRLAELLDQGYIDHLLPVRPNSMAAREGRG